MSDPNRYVRVAMRERDGGTIEGRAPIADHLRGLDGVMRTGPLLSVLDSVGGLCAGLAALPDGWVVSTSLAARVVAPARVGPVHASASVLRAGRNSIVTSVVIGDEGAGGAVVADGVLTSSILVPEHGPPPWSRPLVLDPGDPPLDPPPLAEWLQATAVDGGAVEMPLREELRNPWGILHGGAVAMLVDLAVEHVTTGITRDVVLHFLAPNREGPVRARTRVVGDRSDGSVVRVEVNDEGAGRVTAVAVATAAAAGPATRV